MRKLLITCIALAALSAPAVAQAHMQHASARGVSAKVTYKQGPFNTDRDIHVRIHDHGRLVYDAKLTGTCAKCAVVPKAVHVTNLQGHPDNVVLELYTGGAHCCSYDAIFSPVKGSSNWAMDSWNFGDPGARLRRLSRHGHTVFVTADDRFAYRFADFAESGLPIQILSFAHHSFTDVTRHHRKLIRRDAARYWKAYRKDHHAGRRGLIAAWAADQWNLQHRSYANKVLHAQVAKGRIGSHFVKHLKHFLKRHGYGASSSNGIFVVNAG